MRGDSCVHSEFRVCAMLGCDYSYMLTLQGIAHHNYGIERVFNMKYSMRVENWCTSNG